jgi:hypothetical protein
MEALHVILVDVQMGRRLAARSTKLSSDVFGTVPPWLALSCAAMSIGAPYL